MEIDSIEKMGGYLWQGTCFKCHKEGFICRTPQSSEIKGVWEVSVNDHNGAVLNPDRDIEKCAKRSVSLSS